MTRIPTSSPAGVFDKYTYTETKSIDVDGQPAEFCARGGEDAREMVATRSIEQALETLRSRIDETGVKEPSIVLKGALALMFSFGWTVTQTMAAIGTAVLEFMMVDEDTIEDRVTSKEHFSMLKEPRKTVFDGFVGSLVRNNSIPVGSRLMWEYRELPEGRRKEPNTMWFKMSHPHR